MPIPITELEMNFKLDEDVQRVAEFMLKNMTTDKLVPVARALPLLAELIWTRYTIPEQNNFYPGSLGYPPIS